MGKKIQTPFFMFNPKSYLYGEKITEMADVAEEIAKKYPSITVLLTCQHVDMRLVAPRVKHVKIVAQHMDAIVPGRGMGAILPEGIRDAGAQVVLLNHAEHPMTMDAIIRAMERAEDLGLETIVCANSLKEAIAIATLKPSIILCEPTALIGTGQTSTASYIKSTNQAIKSVSPKTLVMQAAGITSPQDVYEVMELGADGVGCTSGITTAKNPPKMLEDMIIALTEDMGDLP
ncbi:triosephosphate isomerase [Streptococcus varani]|uniref:Triosephosphate isomerase n=2 Tax=Streptococcus varani TaxID=1608583 RepID=A0A0E4H3S1_9STRE|nr:triose-phosphate isomerase [Streptococcus varani]CQR23728.1 triosephosphate isomerase [Streptococcus varani]